MRIYVYEYVYHDLRIVVEVEKMDHCCGILGQFLDFHVNYGIRITFLNNEKLLKLQKYSLDSLKCCSAAFTERI